MISGWPSYKPRGNWNLMKATLVLHILNVLFSLLMLINDLITHVTLSNSYKFVVLSLLFSLRCISPNSHDHYIRQTSRRFAPSAISRACHVQTCDHYSIDIYIWLTSFITALIYIFLPKSNEIVAAVMLLVIYKVVKYHQNQRYGENQL